MQSLGFTGNETRLCGFRGNNAHNHRMPKTLRNNNYKCRSAANDSIDSSAEDIFGVDLRLHQTIVQMNAAVGREDFVTAAALRNQVELLQLSYRRLQLQLEDQDENLVQFEIGKCIVHRKYGYRGVIVGFDNHCQAPEEWMQAMRVDALTSGREQPFYHILVDVKDRPGGQTTYVAQDNIFPVRKPQPVDHPLVSRYLQVLRSQDGSWQYLPTPELRKKLYQDDF